MKIYQNKRYMEDVDRVASLELPWELLQDKTMMISGATGLLGSFLVDVIMRRNAEKSMNCRVLALGRSEEKARSRFEYCFDNSLFSFIPYDVNDSFVHEEIGKVDFCLHLASNTHPVAYATDPIGTITTNVIGLKNMLDFCHVHQTTRFVFASSNEIYGENRGDVELFDESYSGYIDCNTLRAGYPESKRCGEALCQAYIRQYGMDIVIARFTRSYGPTMLMSDTKALSQFIKKALDDADIVLKSAGTQYYSYAYMADSVSGLLTILLCGENGEAYNIADEQSDIRLKDLAGTIAASCGRKVVFEIPDTIESAGYSKATKARLDGSKLKALGWKPYYTIQTGIGRTLTILRELIM